MAVEYVSWKTGDPAIKPRPQVLQPGVWTLVHFDQGDAIVPKHTGIAKWYYYMNIQNAKGLFAAKSVDVRFIRDPKGIKDFTGQRPHDLRIGHIFTNDYNWAFTAKKGQPVGLQVRNNGKRPITLTTREFKMWIP